MDVDKLIRTISYVYFFHVEPYISMIPGPLLSAVTSYYNTFMYLAYSLHRGDLTLQMFFYIIFPKLLTLIAVYAAALSLWRTTRWAVGIAYFIVKWSIIVAFLAGSVGWIIGGEEGRAGLRKVADEVEKVANEAGTAGAASGTGRRPWEKFGGEATYEREQKAWWQAQKRSFEEKEGMAKKIYDYAFNYVWDSTERAQKDGARAYGNKDNKGKGKTKGSRAKGATR